MCVQRVHVWCQAACLSVRIARVRVHVFLMGVLLVAGVNTISTETSDAHSVYETVVHCC